MQHTTLNSANCLISILKVARTALCLFLLAASMSVYGGNGSDSWLRKVGGFIDRMSVSGVDTNYIAAPEKAWQLIMKGNINQASIKMKSHVSAADILDDSREGDIRWRSELNSPVSASAGLWIGYRGYGLGYSKGIGGSDGTNFSIGATGGRYGLFLRYRKNTIDDTEIRINGNIDGKELNEKARLDLDAPLTVKSFIADGYYFFNGKRFSYAAAYDQSVYQIRSAGSLFVGMMWFNTTIDYANGLNAPYIHMMNDIGRMKLWQGSIGCGYAYNYVLSKGWLISGMIMPMLTLVNKSKTYKYGYEDNRLVYIGAKNEWQGIDYNIDGRLSVCRNWNTLFVNVYGQLNHFYYRQGHISGQTFDWFVNFSVGTRF